MQQSVLQSADALDRLTSLADSFGVPRLPPFELLRSGLSDAMRTPPPPATVVRGAARGRPPRARLVCSVEMRSELTVCPFILAVSVCF